MALNRGRTSLIGRAVGFNAEGRGFDPQRRTNTEGPKTTEKCRY